MGSSPETDSKLQTLLEPTYSEGEQIEEPIPVSSFLQVREDTRIEQTPFTELIYESHPIEKKLLNILNGEMDANRGLYDSSRSYEFLEQTTQIKNHVNDKETDEKVIGFFPNINGRKLVRDYLFKITGAEAIQRKRPLDTDLSEPTLITRTLSNIAIASMKKRGLLPEKPLSSAKKQELEKRPEPEIILEVSDFKDIFETLLEGLDKEPGAKKLNGDSFTTLKSNSFSSNEKVINAINEALLKLSKDVGCEFPDNVDPEKIPEFLTEEQSDHLKDLEVKLYQFFQGRL